jgi:hypothetical protein
VQPEQLEHKARKVIPEQPVHKVLKVQPAYPGHKVLKAIRALQVRTAQWQVQRVRKVQPV